MKRISYILSVLLLTICCYSQQENAVKPLAAYHAENFWHVIDYMGKDIITMGNDIEDIAGYSEGLLRVKTKIDGKSRWVFMDLKGETEIKPDCDEISDFSEGMAITIKVINDDNRLYGYINREGKQVVPNEYQDAIAFSEGLAYIMNSSRRGYIDKTGEFAFNLASSLVGYTFSDSMAAVSNSGFQIGFIDRTGKIVIPLQYDEPGFYSEGKVHVNKNGKFGYIDKNGNTLIRFVYDDARKFKEGRAFAGRADKFMIPSWCLIDTTGLMLADFQWDKVDYFREGYAAVRKDNKYGFIDRDGKYSIPSQFTTAGGFVDGLACVAIINKVNTKIGFINKRGDFAVEIKQKPDKMLDLRLNTKMW
jgi:hypothetical protein